MGSVGVLKGVGFIFRELEEEPAEEEAEDGAEGETPEGEGEVGEDDGAAGGLVHGGKSRLVNKMASDEAGELRTVS